MIVTSQSANALGCTTGAWQLWSLSDGYVEMPAELLKQPDRRIQGIPRSFAQVGSVLRLSVNCFLLDRPGADRILIDCGAGNKWHATMGHLGTAMAEAGVDPASITVLALTHTHLDHINGVLTPDGRDAFINLRQIALAEDAVASFQSEEHLARFRPLLAPIADGAKVADDLLAVAMPGHAPGHMGYRLDTGDDNLLFCGDMIHVPAAQFARPELTWGYDLDQSAARATRIKLLRDAMGARTWLAGPHLGRPGIGRIVEQGQGYAFMPVAPAT